MRKQTFIILISFYCLNGCSSATFTTVRFDDASVDGEDKVTPIPLIDSKIDAAIQDANANDAKDVSTEDANTTSIGCAPYSCRTGCAPCGLGNSCGSGGYETCGSSNCAPATNNDNPSNITCAGGKPTLYQCTITTAPDFMPACTFVNTNAGKNWYCCK